jgi:serine/threonine protein kinase
MAKAPYYNRSDNRNDKPECDRQGNPAVKDAAGSKNRRRKPDLVWKHNMTEAEIFAAALELPPEERPAFLDRVCAGDAELITRVEKLLQLAGDTDGFMRQPAVELAGLEHGLAVSGQAIGPYTLVEQVGEGGFGLVFRATQAEPVQRTVAIKLLKRGMDSEAVLKRFELERQSLAAMNHSGIAQVYDAGISESGQHYFVMEFVEGSSITEHANVKQLNSRERLQLFAQVCDAVAHAHQKGILHRDIKPSNVLVTEVEGRSQVKVIDFGIAKAIGTSAQDATQITQIPIMMGTPQYMSPEQADGSVMVDTRTDVYAMGVLLYELLTGRLPFEPDSLKRAALNEVYRIIREEDPPKPSTKLSSISDPDQATIARQRSTEPRSLIRMLRQELEWIPLKAMRKDPDHRYAGASEMGHDIRNYLDGDALVAGPESRIYRVKKLANRYRWPLAAGIAIAASLVAGVIGTSVMAVQAAQQKRLAEERFADVRTLANTFIFDIYKSIRNLPGSTPAVGQLVDTALNYLQKLESSGEIAADDELWLEIAGAYVKLGDVQGNPADNNLGNYPAAIECFEKAKRIFERWTTTHPDSEPAMVGVADATSGLGEVVQYQGNIQAAVSYFTAALDVTQSTLKRWPTAKNVHRVHRIQFMIAAGTAQSGDEKAAKQKFRDAVDFLESHMTDVPDKTLQTDLAMTLGRLGQLQIKFNEKDSAAETLSRSLEVLQQQVTSEPDNSYYIRNLAIGYDHLGRFHLANKELQPAVAAFEEASQSFRSLAELDPDNTRAKRDVINSMTRLGNVLVSMQRFDDAQAAFEHLVELAEQNYRAHPIFDNGTKRATAVESLSRCFIAQGNFERAAEIQEQVIALREELRSSNPDNRMIKQRVAFSRRNLGKSLLELSRPSEALAEFERAAQLNREQYDAAPGADGNPRRLATSLMYAGRSLLMLDRNAEGMLCFEEAIGIRRSERAEKPDDLDAELGLAWLLAEIGESLAKVDSDDLRTRSEAIRQESIALFQKHEDELSPQEREVYERILAE